MNTVHLYVGWATMILFLVFWIWGAIARWRKVMEPGPAFWGLLAVVQVVIGLQALLGLLQPRLRLAALLLQLLVLLAQRLHQLGGAPDLLLEQLEAILHALLP